jgi:hypothetical protein
MDAKAAVSRKVVLAWTKAPVRGFAERALVLSSLSLVSVERNGEDLCVSGLPGLKEGTPVNVVVESPLIPLDGIDTERAALNLLRFLDANLKNSENFYDSRVPGDAAIRENLENITIAFGIHRRQGSSTYGLYVNQEVAYRGGLVGSRDTRPDLPSVCVMDGLTESEVLQILNFNDGKGDRP